MLSVTPEDSYAVLIGISKFPRDEEGLPPLPAVQSNLTDLERLLSDPEVVGFQRPHVVTLVDIDEPRVVGETLFKTAKQAKGTLLIYYAGHGLVGNRHTHELLLAMSSTTQENAQFGALSFDVVQSALDDSRARNKIL